MQLLTANDPGVKQFLGMVRSYMKDYAHKNRLLSDVEADEPALLVYVQMTIDDFNNASTPRTSFLFSNFPSFKILLLGTVIQALLSESLLQIRNRLNYSDGGLTISASDKAGDMLGVMQGLVQEYERKKTDMKIMINAEGAFGGVPSEYATVDFFY